MPAMIRYLDHWATAAPIRRSERRNCMYTKDPTGLWRGLGYTIRSETYAIPSLDKFNVHRSLTRRVISGTGLAATIRYLDH
ncbi:hypothetical protein TNCV_1372981 [Trichonephila clavipes]|uniref:Uncharacterized protein n=1 Tax=Trichonephila clavipes TaxID=2585209 RepID=A0A8X7BLC0_TRICX|nr:hypothetical protein TNCV_1372981 [Trichonephila clavipes]